MRLSQIKKTCKTKAFTLVELIVVIGIFGVIMAVALWNQGALNNNVLITNLAYEIALTVRETQAYGIGVRALPGTTQTQSYQGAFGLHVDMDVPDQIVVFSDADDNKMYSGPQEAFAIHKFQNQRGNRIVALCAGHPTSGAANPCRPGISTAYNEVNVVFKRPNPEAWFFAGTTGSMAGKPGPVVIVVNAPNNQNCRAIFIEQTGQIHVESAASSEYACINQ